MKHIYTEPDSIYLQNNKDWHIADSPWKATKILNLMHSNNLMPKSIAEIGCGAGEILNQLYQRLTDTSIKYYGYDIASDVEIFWKKRKNERIHFYLEDMNQKDVYYDLLLMIDVFEHVEDYFGFIKKSANKAKYKIYHIPLDISVISILRNLPMHHRKTVGHIHYFMKETALATLRECGQEIIDYIYTAGSVELHNQSFSAKLLNIVRRILFVIKKDWAVNLLGGYSLMVLTK